MTYSHARLPVIKTLPRTCEKCGSLHRLEVHHVDVDPTNNERSNLQTLCKTCHVATHRELRGNTPKVVNSSFNLRRKHIHLLTALQLRRAATAGEIVSVSRLVREAIEELARRELDAERFQQLMAGAA